MGQIDPKSGDEWEGAVEPVDERYCHVEMNGKAAAPDEGVIYDKQVESAWVQSTITLDVESCC